MSNWFSGNNNNDSSQSSIDKKKQSKSNDSDDNSSWYSSFNGNGDDSNNKDVEKDKNDDDDDSKDSSFTQTSISFLIWTIVSLIITFLFAINSANLIYYIKIGDARRYFFPNIRESTREEAKENFAYFITSPPPGNQSGGNNGEIHWLLRWLQPDDPQKYSNKLWPNYIKYNDNNNMIGRAMGAGPGDWECRPLIGDMGLGFGFGSVLFNFFNLPPSKGLPYEWYNPDTNSYFNKFLNLGIETTADSFCSLRGFIFYLMKAAENVNNDIGLVILGQLIQIISFVLIIFNWFVPFYKAIARHGVLGLLLWFTTIPTISSVCAVIQYFELLLFFSIIPLLINPGAVRNIIACRAKPLTYFFISLTVLLNIFLNKGIKNNTLMISGILVAFIILVLKGLFF